MNWHLNQMKYALGLGGLMSFYGVVGMIIYLLPPNMVSNQYKIVVIALVLLTLPFSLIFMFVASRREKKKAKKEAEAAQAQAEGAPASPAAAPTPAAAPVGNFANLTSSTEETVQFLKSSNLGSSGRDAVYSLPWYLVAGSPRAGKSSLVVGSNLNFQTLPSQRQSEQKFIRPTGNVDWRVTSDAVFVDTAGRYQSEGVDAEEWASLLETIKKYRGNRPVDGFLLVVNAETILKSDERQTEELAKVLRARLDETMQRLKVRFPVYVVFTHADAIEGFRDSFSSSKNEDKTLVWGATIPIEKSDNAQALFDSEYEILHNSLMKRRIVRLSAPFPPVRQLRIFNFPLHFGSARRKFGSFINALFRPNPFSENPFLRGFYFTASPVGKSNGNAAVVGNTYFTERFFRDVVLRDKDLVRTFIESRQRPPIVGWMLTALGGLTVFALLVMSAISLANNRLLLKDAEQRGGNLRQMIKADAGVNPLEKRPEAVRDELNQMDNMRQFLARLDQYDRENPPLTYRFGLYSGEEIFKGHLLKMYFGVVEQRFKEPAVKKLQADLAKFAASKPVANAAKLTPEEEKNLEKHLNMLKAYLMLTGGDYKGKADPAHVNNVLKEYWLSESKIPNEMRPLAEQQLEFWAKQIDRKDIDYFPWIPINETLVASVRTKLKDFPAEYRYLSRKVSEISRQVDEEIGPMTLEQVLTRAGSDTRYMAGTYRVQGAYTRRGLELMKEAIENAEEEMKKDDWVMGSQGGDGGRGPQVSLIENRYYNDYAIAWTDFIRSVDVKAYRNRNEAAEALQVFSQPNSPMNELMREVVKNTDFSVEADDSWWGLIKSYIWKKKENEVGVTEPEKAFRPLFKFVGKKEDGENAQIEKYKSQLSTLQTKFATAVNSESALQKIAAEMVSDDKDPLEIRKRENAISNIIAPFSESPSSQEAANLLMEPIARLRALLGVGGREQFIKIWNEQVLPAAKKVERGFPFEDGAAEADLKELTAFLAPGEGALSKFYDEKLKNYFDVVDGQYRPKADSEFQFSEEFVAYLNNAFALQKALFGTSSTPKFEYEFALRPVKDALIEVTIDGQKTTSEGTGSLRGTFPGASATETGVLMKLASTSSSTTTTAPPPSTSANSSNSNVSTASGSPSSGSSGDIVEQGQWGLFRFVDRGTPKKSETGEYLLTYTLGGKTVNATIKPIGGDLFDKNIFRRVRAPQTFLK